MQILGIGHNISWLPLPNEIALILDDQLPPLAAITSALALAFDGERILMTNLRQRGGTFRAVISIRARRRKRPCVVKSWKRLAPC